MSCDNPTDCAERHPNAEDAKAERAVLALLLEEHPAQLTIPEVSRALNAHAGGFHSDDAVERSIREQDGAGLVHCRGGFVAPTRAALYLARLEAD